MKKGVDSTGEVMHIGYLDMLRLYWASATFLAWEGGSLTMSEAMYADCLSVVISWLCTPSKNSGYAYAPIYCLAIIVTPAILAYWYAVMSIRLGDGVGFHVFQTSDSLKVNDEDSLKSSESVRDWGGGLTPRTKRGLGAGQESLYERI